MLKRAGSWVDANVMEPEAPTSELSTWHAMPPGAETPGYVYLAQSKLTPLGPLPSVLKGSVVVAVVLSLIDVGMELALYRSFSSATTVFDIDEATWDRYDMSGLLAVLVLLAMIVGGVTTAMLLKRMLDNGAELHPGANDHKSWWAWAGWVVPFLNLVRPFQVVRQAWNTSRSTNDPEHDLTTPVMIRVWWGLFLLWQAGNQAVPTAPWSGATLAQYRNESLGLMLTSGVLVAAGGAYLIVLTRLVGRHEAALHNPGNGGPAPTFQNPLMQNLPPAPVQSWTPTSTATAPRTGGQADGGTDHPAPA